MPAAAAAGWPLFCCRAPSLAGLQASNENGAVARLSQGGGVVVCVSSSSPSVQVCCAGGLHLQEEALVTSARIVTQVRRVETMERVGVGQIGEAGRAVGGMVIRGGIGGGRDRGLVYDESSLYGAWVCRDVGLPGMREL